MKCLRRTGLKKRKQIICSFYFYRFDGYFIVASLLFAGFQFYAILCNARHKWKRDDSTREAGSKMKSEIRFFTGLCFRGE